jgi:hypothetical protein
MNGLRRHELVLSIYPNTRGFAFVLFEGPLTPIDWAVTEMRGPRKNERCLRSVTKLVSRYEPDALVIQDTSEAGTRRARRVRNLNGAIGELAEAKGVPVFAYSRAQVRHAFRHIGSGTKHAIAETIAKHIPAFARYLPPVRKPWMSEDVRMGLFDAAALALMFFRAESEGNSLAA